ncbi:helix-turn-helix domain-containing protein [Pseudobdellovibrio exovorus]|uniref:J domain-containing protein n=1 Tax=Pseudobdellovibrio exovorus JSS TaxID=1184267 RepID=M4V4T2_9BACT|nr:helix-turn-helix domain-containing protein [Pseudobdellovibrio exovorus]AGH94347.1 hypothetical protein A11Q_127 [Pseudobdellovibrio exovorus JSS]
METERNTENNTQCNYYELLGISESATQQEILVAYQKAKKTYSAENKALSSVFTPEEATQLRTLIEEAYEVLSNNTYRNIYERRVLASTYQKVDLSAESIKSASDSLFQRVTPPVVSMTAEPESTTSNVEMTPAVETVAPVAAASVQKAVEKPVAAPVHPDAPVIDPAYEALLADKKEWTGQDLKAVREYRKLSFDELTDITKINPWYIAAIEDMDPANLPVAVFVRGYVVQLAKALGLKDKLVAESYMRHFRKKIEN